MHIEDQLKVIEEWPNIGKRMKSICRYNFSLEWTQATLQVGINHNLYQCLVRVVFFSLDVMMGNWGMLLENMYFSINEALETLYQRMMECVHDAFGSFM